MRSWHLSSVSLPKSSHSVFSAPSWSRRPCSELAQLASFSPGRRPPVIRSWQTPLQEPSRPHPVASQGLQSFHSLLPLVSAPRYIILYQVTVLSVQTCSAISPPLQKTQKQITTNDLYSAFSFTALPFSSCCSPRNLAHTFLLSGNAATVLPVAQPGIIPDFIFLP